MAAAATTATGSLSPPSHGNFSRPSVAVTRQLIHSSTCKSDGIPVFWEHTELEQFLRRPQHATTAPSELKPPSPDNCLLRGSSVVVDAEIFRITLFRNGVSGVKSLGCKLLNCEEATIGGYVFNIIQLGSFSAANELCFDYVEIYYDRVHCVDRWTMAWKLLKRTVLWEKINEVKHWIEIITMYTDIFKFICSRLKCNPCIGSPLWSFFEFNWNIFVLCSYLPQVIAPNYLYNYVQNVTIEVWCQKRFFFL